MDTPTIGSRVRALLERSGTTQRALAESVAMTTDALSRAISGQRGFAAIEVARIATELGVEVHWLITGEDDTQQLKVAARHDYDRGSRSYGNDTRAQDEHLLRDVRLAYRQAFGDRHPSPTDLPTHLADVREMLGDDWVRDFAQRLEDRLEVDVIRVEELGTAYSFWVLGRAVVALPDTAPWGRANFSLAHELAHLVRRDHDDTPASRDAENAANQFAAELLMPVHLLREVEWDHVTAPELGDLLWGLGVTTEALRTRLAWLRIEPHDLATSWLALPTPTFLRKHAFPASRWTAVTERERLARARRFPTALTQVLEDGVACGRVNPKTLAWVLGVPVDDLEVQPPQSASVSTDELATSLGLTLG